MRICLFFLFSFLFLFSFSQRVLPEIPERIKPADFGYALKDIHVVQSQKDLCGFILEEKRNQIPVFLSTTIAESLELALSPYTEVSEPIETFSIQVQKFWLTDYTPTSNSTKLQLFLDFDFFIHLPTGEISHAYSHRPTIYFEKPSSDLLVSATIAQYLDSALTAFSVSIVNFDLDAAERLPAADLDTRFMGNELNQEDLDFLKGKTGVIRVFEDVKNRLLLPYTPVRLGNVGGDAYKVKIPLMSENADHWGVVIDGELYFHFKWGYQHIHTDYYYTTYVAPNKNSSTGAMIAGVALGGIAGGVVAGALTSSRGMPQFLHEWYRLDMTTGDLHYIVTDPDITERAEFLFFHSSFSRANEIKVRIGEKEVKLKPEEYALIKIVPSRDESCLKAFIEHPSGTEAIDLTFDWKQRSLTSLIWKKDKFRHNPKDASELTLSDYPRVEFNRVGE